MQERTGREQGGAKGRWGTPSVEGLGGHGAYGDMVMGRVGGMCGGYSGEQGRRGSMVNARCPVACILPTQCSYILHTSAHTFPAPHRVDPVVPCEDRHQHQQDGVGHKVEEVPRVNQVPARAAKDAAECCMMTFLTTQVRTLEDGVFYTAGATIVCLSKEDSGHVPP